jgi:sugar phosphate isomerase/epimerase
VLAANGIKLGYHNHAGEFKETAYGAFIHKELEETTDVAFEIDTYWAYVAGLDPVATLERLKDRVDVIHIKDGSADGHGEPLGRGTAPVAAVYAKANELGMRLVVESETLTPSGLDEARICYEYLKSLEG